MSTRRGRIPESRAETADGLEQVFAINVLAPYLLTALIARPRRLIYFSSRSTAATTWCSTTKMGGTGAPDDLKAGAETQVWLAAGDDPDATATGRYL